MIKIPDFTETDSWTVHSALLAGNGRSLHRPLADSGRQAGTRNIHIDDGVTNLDATKSRPDEGLGRDDT